jgi:outer membrane beta-barrel protein
MLGLVAFAATAAEPGPAAIGELTTPAPHAPVENVYFLGAHRLELAPSGGSTLDNPFATSAFGALSVAWHSTEKVAFEGSFAYAPAPRVKALTHVVVGLSGAQPFEELRWSGSLAARWSPGYGKINLVGEKVLNFHAYGVAGVGLVGKDDEFASGSASDVAIAPLGHEVDVAAVTGLGLELFVSRSVALRLDGRAALSVDEVPDYSPDTVDASDSRQHVASDLVASAGLAFYLPRAKARITAF